MEIFLNNGHKKMVINKELNPVKVHCHVNDKIININLYSGCLDLNSLEELPIEEKDSYDVEYDLNNDLFVMDGLETDNISCLFKDMYESKMEGLKHR